MRREFSLSAKFLKHTEIAGPAGVQRRRYKGKERQNLKITKILGWGWGEWGLDHVIISRTLVLLQNEMVNHWKVLNKEVILFCP